MGILQWLLASTIAIVHPFYISMTDINHNNKTQTLEVSVRIFADDFESVLRKKCNCKVELIKPADKPAMEKLVSNYIASHLSIKVDEQQVPLNFIGYSEENGSAWNYFEIKNIKGFKKLEVYNKILHDYNEQQVNMVHVRANGKERTQKLDYPTNTYTVNF